VQVIEPQTQTAQRTTTFVLSSRRAGGSRSSAREPRSRIPTETPAPSSWCGGERSPHRRLRAFCRPQTGSTTCLGSQSHEACRGPHSESIRGEILNNRTGHRQVASTSTVSDKRIFMFRWVSSRPRGPGSAFGRHLTTTTSVTILEGKTSPRRHHSVPSWDPRRCRGSGFHISELSQPQSDNTPSPPEDIIQPGDPWP